jgi:antitoxin component YwqK of YwqJK toxin-antitoxin module
MKRILLIVLLLIVGCSKEPINIETLVEQDDVFYTIDTKSTWSTTLKPYSGRVFSLYDSGQKLSEGTLKDGKKDGKWTHWYENGQKSSELTYKDGKQDGLWTRWYDNGQKKEEGTYKGVNTVGHQLKNGLSTSWFPNGQKSFEGTFKDGEKDGLWTSWYEYDNGQKESEVTWKNGKLIFIKEWTEDGSVY